MAARAYWKGFLRLSLVSIAVEIYNAVESKSEISFRQIHKPSGRRINYTKTVQGIGEVKNSDIVKGYEVDNDTYVTLEPGRDRRGQAREQEDDRPRQVRRRRPKSIRAISSARISSPRPTSTAGEGYVVIREALKKTGKVGLAQLTIGGPRVAGRHHRRSTTAC